MAALRSRCPRGGDIIPLLDLQDRTAGKAGILCPAHRQDRDDRVDKAGAEDTRDGNGKDQVGKGQHRVAEAHDKSVHAAAGKARDDPQESAQEHGRRHQDQCAGYAHSGAEYHPGQQVPAQEIRAEAVLRAGGLESIPQLAGRRLIRRDLFGEQGDQDDQQNKDQIDGKCFVVFEKGKRLFHFLPLIWPRGSADRSGRSSGPPRG